MGLEKAVSGGGLIELLLLMVKRLEIARNYVFIYYRYRFANMIEPYPTCKKRARRHWLRQGVLGKVVTQVGDTCLAIAVVYCMIARYMIDNPRRPLPDVSPDFLSEFAYRPPSEIYDDEINFRSAFSIPYEYGVCSSAVFSWNGGIRNVYPSARDQKEAMNYYLKQGRVMRIDGHGYVQGDNAYSKFLAVEQQLKYGPIIGCIDMNDRFVNHRGNGVFEYSSVEKANMQSDKWGKVLLGSHAMVIYGCYWTGKYGLVLEVQNSYGLMWGEKGRGRIAATSMDLEAFYYVLRTTWSDSYITQSQATSSHQSQVTSSHQYISSPQSQVTSSHQYISSPQSQVTTTTGSSKSCEVTCANTVAAELNGGDDDDGPPEEVPIIVGEKRKRGKGPGPEKRKTTTGSSKSCEVTCANTVATELDGGDDDDGPPEEVPIIVGEKRKRGKGPGPKKRKSCRRVVMDLEKFSSLK